MAVRTNYIIVFKQDNQVYGAGTRENALEMPPPDGMTLEDKRIFFLTYQTDNDSLVIHQMPKDEIVNAEIKLRKPREKKAESE